MQNLVVLCSCCISWIEPCAEVCPECGAAVLLDHPDLDQDELNELLGSPLLPLGLVSIERTNLPNMGLLVGTTRGVMFLPQLHRRINGAWEGVTTHRPPGWWPFRNEAGSAGFLNWLRRPWGMKTEMSAKATAGADLDPVSLSDRLMDSPGAFFIQRRLIRSVAIRRRTIKFDRTPLRIMTIVDETENESLATAFASMCTQGDWSDLQIAN